MIFNSRIVTLNGNYSESDHVSQVFLTPAPEVQLLDKVKVQNIVREDREENAWPLVHLSDGRILRSRLLVSDYMRYPNLLLQPIRSVQTDSTRLSGHTLGYNLTGGRTTHTASSRHCSMHHVHPCLEPTLWPTNVSCPRDQ